MSERVRLRRSAAEIPEAFRTWFASGATDDQPLEYLVDGRSAACEGYWRRWQEEDLRKRRGSLTEFLRRGGWDIGS